MSDLKPTINTVLRSCHLDTYLTSLVLSARRQRISMEVQALEKLDFPWTDHDICLNEVFKPHGIPVSEFRPVSAETFVLQLAHAPGWNDQALHEAIHASRDSKRRIVIYDAKFGSPFSVIKIQLRMILKHPALLRCFKDFLYYDGWMPFDMFSLFRRRRRTVSIGPNINISDPQNRANLLSDWQPSAKRTGKICFFGSMSDHRLRLLESIREAMPDAISPTFRTDINPDMAKGVEFPWLAGRGLSWQDLPVALTNWDFALCLPGCATWTHRVFESVMRGCLPILPATELLYQRGLLRPGETCLVVDDAEDPRDWARAIRLGLSFSYEELKRRRELLWQDTLEARTDLDGHLLRNSGIINS